MRTLNMTENEPQIYTELDELEQRVQQLETTNQMLREEVDYFNLIFPSYADAINLLKARIENLESKL